MGSTVLTGKSAAAFVRPDGTIIYIAFERTYEKNCYPHSDHWSCVAIGQFKDVMRRLFVHAGSTEGGMLQSRNGYIKPENYIAAWRRELASPSQMRDKVLRLSLGKSLYSTIPSEQAEAVKAILSSIGRDDVYERMVADDCSLSLQDDYPIIDALYGAKGPLAPWRILSHGDIDTVPQPGLGFTPAVGNVVGPRIRVHRLDNENLIVQIGTEPWQHAGWAYSAVASFIGDVVYMLEMECTGASASLIRNFREECRLAAPLPADTIITVIRDGGEAEKWYVESADRLATKLGIAKEDGATPPQFTFKFSDVVDRDGLFELRSLKTEQVSWDVPDLTVGPVDIPAQAETPMSEISFQEALF